MLLDVKTYNKKWRQENKDRIRVYSRRSNLKYKMAAFRFYSGKIPHCACCGEKNIFFLTIDHINNDGPEDRKKGIQKTSGGLYFYLKKRNYPSGFQVLCYNCNCSKKIFGICIHKVSEEEQQKWLNP